MIKSSYLRTFLVFLPLLALLSYAQTPQKVMTFNASLAAQPNSYILWTNTIYQWLEISPSQNQTLVRQTMLNFNASENISQIQLSLSPYMVQLAYSENLTCMLVYLGSDNSFKTYYFDPINLVVNEYANIQNIPELFQNGGLSSTFKVSSGCYAIQINDTVYYYNYDQSQYQAATINENLNNGQLFLDQDQFQTAIIGNKIYDLIFNENGTNTLKYIRNQQHFGDVQIIVSYKFPQRFIIFSTEPATAAGDQFLYKISVNKKEQINQQTQFTNIYSIKGVTLYEPLQIVYDSTLQKFGYGGMDLNNQLLIGGGYINYDHKKFFQFNPPAQFAEFISLPYVSLSQNFAYIRQKIDPNGQQRPIRQQVYQFFGSQWILFNQRQVPIDENVNWKNTHLIQDQTQLTLLYQSQINGQLYQIYKTDFNKTTSQSTIDNQTNPNLFQFFYPSTASGHNILRASTTPKWFFNSINDTNSPVSIMTEVLFVPGLPNNQMKIQNNQSGNWVILGVSKQNLTCLAAYNQDNSKSKLFYYNQTSGLAQQKSDISGILTTQGVSNPVSANIRVSNNCLFFSIGDIVYRSNSTNYNNVTVPDGWVNVDFDQSFKIAVFNGNIYQYNLQNNRYYGVFFPEKPVLSSRQINLNVDKLIILSYEKNNTANPPVSKYRIHCLRSNGTNWNLIDVAIEGIQLYGDPGMKISPNYQTFGMGGTDQTGAPYVQARIVNYTTMTSKNVTIPSQILTSNQNGQYQYAQLSDNFLYFRIMSVQGSSNPLTWNYEEFYSIDKQNAFLPRVSKRNMTLTEQLSWQNTYISQINGSMTVFYQYQSFGTVSLVAREIGSLNETGPSAANVQQTDTGVLTVNGQVFMCPIGCTSCLSASNCDSCSYGFALNPITSICDRCAGQCMQCSSNSSSSCTACFPGSYLDQNNQCSVCDQNCSQCAIQSTKCTSCKIRYLIVSDSCVKCPLQNCLSCSDISTCTICRPGFILDASNQCVQCPSVCSICDPNNIFVCLACSTGYQLFNSQCVPCSQNCNSCVGQSCSQCKDGYKIGKTGKCVQLCTFPCMSCLDSNPQSCLSCSGEYLLSGNNCIPNSQCNQTQSCKKCALGYVLFNGFCYPCQTDSSCKQCDTSDSTVCVSCKNGYFLSSDSSCTSCPSTCSRCQSSLACTSCVSGYTLSGNSSISQCLPCQLPCLTCSQSPQNCLSCSSLYILDGWKCRSLINVYFSLELNINFNSITTALILAIVNDLITITSANANNLTLTQYRQGSTVMGGSIDQSDPAAVFSTLSTLHSITSGSTLGGQPVISSTFIGNTNPSPTSSTSNNMLAIILGVVGAAIVVTVIVVTIICCKIRRNKLQMIHVNQMGSSAVVDFNMKELKISKEHFYNPAGSLQIITY